MPTAKKVFKYNALTTTPYSATLYSTKTSASLTISKDYLECFFDLHCDSVCALLSTGKKLLLRLRDWYGLYRWPFRALHSVTRRKLTENISVRTQLISQRIALSTQLRDEYPSLAKPLLRAQELAESHYTAYELDNFPKIDSKFLAPTDREHFLPIFRKFLYAHDDKAPQCDCSNTRQDMTFAPPTSELVYTDTPAPFTPAPDDLLLQALRDEDFDDDFFQCYSEFQAAIEAETGFKPN